MPDQTVGESDAVGAIREFNRFYTARLGLLRRRYLDGEFSLTEARILYEISAQPELTAACLRTTLELDAGYISRLLGALTRKNLIRQTPSRADGRVKFLTLAPAGERKMAELNRQSQQQIEELLSPFNSGDRNVIVDALSKARSILSRTSLPDIRIVRVREENEDLSVLLEEYYEAIQVVQRDAPGALQRMLDAPYSGCWLAYLDGKAVGCVMLRKLNTFPLAAECKRLYVQPSARGRHIAETLLDALEQFALGEGVEWIYLDTYDDLKAALALYRKRGYVACERYNDNPQATVFLRKQMTVICGAGVAAGEEADDQRSASAQMVSK